MADGRMYGGSNMAILLQSDRIPCSSESLESFLISSSPSFPGSKTMVNFEDVGRNTPERSVFRPLDQEEAGDDELDECFHQPEKKRKLTADQVQFLEKNFEVENKLEPERKIQLARELGLQPRQVAIWFQNRRARWKTKQLEKDYDALKTAFNSLKADYESLLKEKEKLKSEVVLLTDKLHLKEKHQQALETSELDKTRTNLQLQMPEADDSVSDKKKPDIPLIVPKQEDLSSTNSTGFDSKSPHYTDGGHPSLLEPADSSNIFEQDQSDLSHADDDEEDNLSKALMHPAYRFQKLEDAMCPDPPVNSCSYGFQIEDHPCWFWS